MSQELLTEFEKFCAFDYEVIKDWNPAELSTRYPQLLSQGREQGFHPVFVVWDDMLIEQIDVELGEPAERDAASMREKMADLTRRLLISASEYVNLDRFLAERAATLQQESPEPKLDLAADFDMEDKSELELLDFLYQANDVEGDAGEADAVSLLLVKVPTVRPEEVFAHFPIGGVNGCPESATLVALAARWRERYGAVPAVITYDAVEFYVERPPATVADAGELAREHYLVCPELVWEICGDMETLTGNLIKNVQWFFWWD